MDQKQNELKQVIQDNVQTYLDNETEVQLQHQRQLNEMAKEHEEKAERFQQMVRSTFDQKLTSLKQSLNIKADEIKELQKQMQEEAQKHFKDLRASQEAERSLLVQIH